ncbi:hypothetical protein FIBSPDRAFT_1049789 [Athelia psychrophila]|uniref:DUF6533 domain-containing protein n=1 Tax=Athelia psychrophila TaxID=1759441 RepID=A0A166BPW7_9AGAM|nr:hypothetical protein FIBSPDRAFT_1049789 [Fibularhizoctonia sp. CBS 109695]
MNPARRSDLIEVTPATLLVSVLQQQETRTATYITVCSLTILLWDWILAIGEELRIVKRCGRNHAVLAYFLARASAVMVCVLGLAFFTKVLPDENRCSGLFNWIGVMTVAGMAAKAYLFLLRVRAVYDNSKLVTLVSGVGWLVMVFARMKFAFVINTSLLNQIGHCAVNDLGSLPTFLWLNVAYDTCIFVSISVRLASHTKFTGTPWILSCIRGYGLPPTMRHLLQDGQKYYGITTLFTLLAAVLAVSPVNPVYQTMFPAPAFAVETVMACQVFRAMILRSLRPVQNVDSSVASAEAHTTGMSIFELDTSLELRIRTTNTEHEQVW